MYNLGEVACIAAIGALAQFVAAIIGPRALSLVSLLFIVAASGIGGLKLLQAYQAQFAGYEGQLALDVATSFGALAGMLLVAHLVIRTLFRAMARASRA